MCSFLVARLPIRLSVFLAFPPIPNRSHSSLQHAATKPRLRGHASIEGEIAHVMGYEINELNEITPLPGAERAARSRLAQVTKKTNLTKKLLPRS